MSSVIFFLLVFVQSVVNPYVPEYFYRVEATRTANLVSGVDIDAFTQPLLHGNWVLFDECLTEPVN
jgi:hypothetical protein